MKLKPVLIFLLVASCALFVVFGWEPIKASTRKIITTLPGRATVSVSSIANRGVVNASQNPNVVGDGLVGYWRFDGPDISAAAIVADMSGGGNICAIASNPNRVPGIVGQALEFYRDLTTRQYCTVGSYTAIEADVFTVAFWVRGKGTSQPEGFARVISKTGSATNNPGWEIMVNGSNDTVRVRADTSAGTAQDSYGTVTLFDDQWHFVALTVNNGTWELYKDGVSQGTATYTAGTGLANSGQALRFGVRTNNVNNAAFRGTVDEVRMYNRVITAAEVSLLYNSSNH